MELTVGAQCSGLWLSLESDLGVCQTRFEIFIRMAISSLYGLFGRFLVDCMFLGLLSMALNFVNDARKG